MHKTIAAGAGLALTGGLIAALSVGEAGERRRKRLRGWALYQFARTVAPNLSDPTVLRMTIARDRAAGPALPPEQLRSRISFDDTACGGMRVFRVAKPGGAGTATRLLYLHGGAYVLDLQTIQWNLVAGLLDRLDVEIIIPLYPLAPEADWRRTMAAVRDHYLALAEEYGAASIVIAGDSSGGGIALLLAQALRDAGEPQPCALVLFSPCLDLSGSGPDQPAIEKRDPALSLRLVEEISPMWAKDVAPDDPRVSPLFADQHDLPPTIVFSGDRDILDSDALRLKQRNPPIDHRHYPEMMHVWVVSPLKEARQALNEAAGFVRQHAV
ncbi:alpha/beta hydrolase [Sphingomonas sp. CLY1604]|uniref:alpha/beta hydrolase n=1 Tax=Sphingomonas sp. CLY1604 TaxID=3457786 RepID=UPI003FD7FCD7